MTTDPNPFAAPETSAAAPLAAPPGALRTADAGSRFFARLVDNVLLGVAFLPSFLIHTAMGSPDPEVDPLPALLAWSPSGAIATGLVGWQWYRVSVDGTTVGKRMADIRIVDRAGRPPGFFVGVALRGWVLQSVQGCLGGIGTAIGLLDASMVFSDQGRTLHDRIAGTRVVRGRVPKPSEAAAAADDGEDFELD